MLKSFKLTHLLILALFVLSACNMPVSGGSASPTEQTGLVQTAAAETVQAIQTQLAATSPATGISTQVTESATSAPATEAVINTAVPSLTPVTMATLAPTAAPTPCDRGSFVSDVTVADGTNFAPGTSFTKTWRIQNNGTCTWTNAYKAVFVSGDAMSGPASVSLPGSVAPGQSVDISVTFKAPTAAKTYQSNWQLQNAAGANFGLGTKATQPFWVKIVVGGTSEPGVFAVTGVSTSHTVSDGACPRTVTFSAAIKVNKAGTVTYSWKRSDNATSNEKSVVFDKAGTKTVTQTWKLGDSGTVTGWEQIYIDQPNHQAFAKENFSFDCP